jgi:DinB superfamily
VRNDTDPAVDVSGRLAQLDEAVDALVTRWRGAAEVPAMRAAPDREWSTIQVIAHVVEFLPYWARQAAAVAARDDATASFGRTHDDPDRIAWVARHADDGLAGLLDELERAARDASSTLSAVPVERWARRGRHPTRGEMSVAQLVDQFMIGHVAEHAEQADRAFVGAVPPS